MTRKSMLVSAAAAAALMAALGTPVASHDDDHGGRKSRRLRLKADLRGFSEVPSVSSTGRGSLRAALSKDETEIEYRLDFSGLQAAVTQAHIHLGDHHTNGGVSIFLCGTATNPGPAGTPVCGQQPQDCSLPGDDEPEACGTLTKDGLVGPAGQGIAGAAAGVGSASEFAELVKAIKAGVTYANVHSTTFPGGEIRGQIKVD